TRLHKSCRRSHRNLSTYLSPDSITSFHFPKWPILVRAASLLVPASPWPHGAHFCALRKTSKQTAHSTFWPTARLRPTLTNSFGRNHDRYHRLPLGIIRFLCALRR